MKDKMIELDYEKLNALYETFVPQTKIPIEQTYLLTPSTSNVPSKSSKEMSDLPVKKMPNESKLLKLFVKLDKPIGDLQTKIDQTILEDRSIALIFDDQDVLRQFYKTRSMEKKVEQQSQKDKKFQNEIDCLLETSLSREIIDCVLLSVEKHKNEMLVLEKEKLSNESKDIQAIMEQQIKILENDFKRAEAQYVNLDLKMQHQKEKMACDVSWKSKMTKLSDENVLLKLKFNQLFKKEKK
ncbi:hypothetical protein Tco_0076796 [Tanacetum coccineum]